MAPGPSKHTGDIGLHAMVNFHHRSSRLIGSPISSNSVDSLASLRRKFEVRPGHTGPPSPQVVYLITDAHGRASKADDGEDRSRLLDKAASV